MFTFNQSPPGIIKDPPSEGPPLRYPAVISYLYTFSDVSPVRRFTVSLPFGPRKHICTQSVGRLPASSSNTGVLLQRIYRIAQIHRVQIKQHALDLQRSRKYRCMLCHELFGTVWREFLVHCTTVWLTKNQTCKDES